ncbi:MAG TPA: metallophosphoesterase [Acidimicrobiia bacterium]|nr:metallophosphoesterase [Acidimicrobiia bacterium]
MFRRVTASRRVTAIVSSLLVLTLLLVAARRAPSARAEDEAVLLAAGDVAACLNPGAMATAKLLSKEPNAAVAMLGDGAYPASDLPTYQQCYTPSWGSADNIAARIHPVTGNHEYSDSSEAVDYFDYFGDSAGPRLKGYYSYNLAGWHVIVLNANCAGNVPAQLPSNPDGCSADSVQGQWLQADLAAHATPCMIAMWHEPRFFSVAVPNGVSPGNLQPSSDPTMDGMWQILQNAGVDVVLNGHWHDYERFPRLSLPPGTAVGPGVPDPNGMREFIVGTGGGPHHVFQVDAQGNPTLTDPNSEVRIDRKYGVLRLALHPTGYDWEYLSSGTPGTPAAGTALDKGSDTCGAGATPPPTTTPTATTPPTTPPGTGPGPTSAADRSGYWMVGADGRVYPFGAAQGLGDAAPSPGAETVDIEPTPARDGYWIVDSAGAVTARGAAAPLGSVAAGTVTPAEEVTSLSATPSGRGYWIFTNRGRVLTFGDAVSYGDMAKVTLNGPVLDSIPTPTGHGYYMVASDGGIFAFGDAVFRGSMGGKRLNAPVQSLVPVPSGGGYWLVAADGGVFAFDAPFRGSMGGTRLAKPITGMVPYGDGYLMVGEDGGIFSFSNQAFAGSLGANPPAHPIVSVAAL